MSNRAGIYGRQSHASKKSIDEQFAEGERDATAEGCALAERYSDGSSASRFASKGRDDWPRVLADIDARRIDVLVLWESSRGDRTLTSWSALLDLCRERGVLIRVTSHERTYDPRVPRDWKSLADDGVDSAYESEKTSVRIRRDLAAMAAAGRPHGRVRYGYERIYDPTTGKLTGEREHPEQAAVVRFIVRQVGRSVPIVVLVRWLTMLLVPPPGDGKRWYASTVRDIASSPTYAGVRVHHADRHAAIWPALVTEVEHLAALRVLSDPKRKTTRPGRQVWMLSYLARCGVCGAGMNRQSERPRVRECYRGTCGHVSINAPELDRFVLDVLARWLWEQRLEPLANDGEALAAHAEAEALARRLDEWRDSAARGETTPASLARIEPRLTEQIREARARAERASTPAVLRDVTAGRPSEAVIRERLDALAAPAQREIIGSLLTIVINRPTRRASRTNPIDYARIVIKRR